MSDAERVIIEEEIRNHPKNKGCDVCGKKLVVEEKIMKEGYICGNCI